MSKVLSIILTELMGVFILISEINFCPDDLGEDHPGNCTDGMMEGEVTAKTEIHNKIEFHKEKNCFKLQTAGNYVIPDQDELKPTFWQLDVIASFVTLKLELPFNSLRGTPLV